MNATPDSRTACAIYHRVSTLDQDPSTGSKELRRVAASLDMDVVHEAQETASGSTHSSSRPKLSRVLKMAEAGQVSAVLVWKLDRFGRSALDVLGNIKRLEDAGCRFVCTSQSIDIKPGGDPMSRLLLTMLAAVAEFERSLIRERTVLGLRRARANGVTLGRPRTRPAGDVAKALRATGKSWAAIAAELGCSKTAAWQACH
jgi:putative DNA-invertase from lambdoid prophage Rac